MEIVRMDEDSTTTFEQIKAGVVFGFQQDIYMKVQISPLCEINAVNLGTGHAVWFEDFEEIFPVKAKLIVE